MSKSLGNVIDPKLVIEGGNNLKKEPAYGADVLRLWVATVDYSSDVRIGPNAIKQVFEQYRKLRNTLRYMVGNVADVPEEGSSEFGAYDAAANYDSLPSLDKWLLGRLNALEVECYDAYDSYQFQRAVNALSAFATNELSALYLDVAKDRLYVSPQDSARRRSCQSVLIACLNTLPRLLAPLLPHLAEELWQALPYKAGDAFSSERGSVFDLAEPWTRGSLAPFQAHDEAKWDARRQLRDDANRALEAARRDKLVGASLDAKVVVAPPADAEKRAAFDASLAGLADTSQVIAPHGKDVADAVDDLRFLFLVSDVEVLDTSDAVCGVCADQHVVSSADSFTGATVGVVEASTARCARCWYHDSTVGSLANHPALCARCGDAVGDDV